MKRFIPVLRFIPTRVGNTRSPRTITVRGPVHPHACGEYGDGQLSLGIHRGSSPRVWGIQISSIMGENDEVHPHACGEYALSTSQPTTTNGSSPRVWGIPDDDLPQDRTGRFIPTRVGNTNPHGSHFFSETVHPHACGEYPPRASSRRVMTGSSPRVWGIHPELGSVDINQRFIPTRVGNTLQEDAKNNRLLA